MTGTRVPSPNDVASLKAPPLSELEDYAKTQWEALLDFYVDDERNPPPQLPRCLKKMGLAPLSGAQLLAAAGLRTMSRKGATLLEGFDGRFAFLMRPPASQLWQVIRGYVQQLSKAGGADAVASLGLLLEAAYMEPGQPYVLEGRPRAEQQVVAHLCQLGVLLPLESGAQVGFCATHLASVLGGASGSAAAGTQGSVMSGGIVTETNFKVSSAAFPDVNEVTWSSRSSRQRNLDAVHFPVPITSEHRCIEPELVL